MKQTLIAILVLALVSFYSAPLPVYAQNDSPLGDMGDMIAGDDGPGGGGPAALGQNRGGRGGEMKEKIQERRKAMQEERKANQAEIQKFRQEMKALFQEYRKADEATRPAILEKMRAHMKEGQAKIVEALKKRLEEMKARQVKLEERLKKIESEGDQMINDRLEKMTARAAEKGQGPGQGKDNNKDKK